jgi:Putative polyhydroxyalkanoic acid system protein (PHA_gran_rgn)
MPSFRAEVEHSLGREQAVEKLRSFSDSIREAYQHQVTVVREVWDTDGNLEFSFVVMGFSIDGRVQVDHGRASVNGSLPFAAIVFKGQIEKEIRQRLGEILI